MQREQMTVDEMRRRKDLLKQPSHIFNLIKGRVAAMEDNQVDELEIGILDESDLPEYLKDIEEEANEGSEETVEPDALTGFEASSNNPILYNVLVREFCKWMLEERLESGESRVCHLCQADDSVDERQRVSI